MGSFSRVAQWVGDLALPQLQLRFRLQLGSDSLPGNSICHRAVKKRKKKKKKDTGGGFCLEKELFERAGRKETMCIAINRLPGLVSH